MYDSRYNKICQDIVRFHDAVRTSEISNLEKNIKFDEEIKVPAILDRIWGVRLGGFASMWLHGYAGMRRSGHAARRCGYRACGLVV